MMRAARTPSCPRAPGTVLPASIPNRRVLPVPRFRQPDDVSCGPTCLAQVMASFGEEVEIPDLMARIRRNPDGGTQAVHIADLAMELGYRVRLYPFGVRVFDPSWWDLLDSEIIMRLGQRASALEAAEADPAEVETVLAWRDVLRRGAHVAFKEPSPALIAGILARGRPVIVGLNATWLYRAMRERPDDNESDDLLGWPVGHFVTVSGYTGGGLHLHVRDPSEDAPDHLHPEGAGRGNYPVPGDRLVHAILLGDLTRDAVLLEIWPARRRAAPRS